tara:strand:- start:158 stop:274 length:117 start_codon:yes stop_codon:yes gene_type:complete
MTGGGILVIRDQIAVMKRAGQNISIMGNKKHTGSQEEA